MIEVVKNARQKLLADLSRHVDGPLQRSSKMSRHLSVPEMRGASRISNDASKLLLENVVSETHRENYEKIVQKAKEREIRLMNKMLKNEEMKNVRYEDLAQQQEIAESKEHERERKRNWALKKAQEDKILLEFEKMEVFKRDEQKQRLDAQERMRIAMEKQAIEQQKELTIQKERQREMAEKERIRKEKAAKVEKMRQQEMIQQEIKLNLMREKLTEKEKLIKLQREEIKRKAKLRKQQFEA